MFRVGQILEQRIGYLLIADISGFTQFIKIHDVKRKPLVGSTVASYWESHAEVLIKDLIEVIIAAFEPCMNLNKKRVMLHSFSLRITELTYKLTQY